MKIIAPEETTKTTHLHSTTKSTKPPFKMEVAARAFIECGTDGMNSLEANNEYGETCLHTSVSTLTHNHGINFKYQPESIKNRAGSISRFTRYSLLTDDDVLRAKKLINHYRSRRGLLPINLGGRRMRDTDKFKRETTDRHEGLVKARTWKVYRLAGGLKSGLICSTSRYSAIAAFCRLHSVYPDQVAMLYCYPLISL